MIHNWHKIKKPRKTRGSSSVRDMIRTRDLLIRSQTLYPAELRAHSTDAILELLFSPAEYMIADFGGNVKGYV